MVQFLNSGEVAVFHKCRSAQIGIGVCLKNRLCVGSRPAFGIGFYIQTYAGIVQWYSILLSKRRDLSSNLSSRALSF